MAEPVFVADSGNWDDARLGMLHRLCAHHGIATHYHDAWGQYRQVAPDSLLALLREFDPAADTPDGLDAALERADAARWNEPLSPVVAVHEDDPRCSVVLCLPADTSALHWQLRDEGG